MIGTGSLVKIKKDFLNPGERQIPYLVVQGGHTSIQIKPLSQYVSDLPIIPAETVAEYMVTVIDEASL